MSFLSRINQALGRADRKAYGGLQAIRQGLFGAKTEKQHQQEAANAARLQDPITAARAAADIPDVLKGIMDLGGLNEEAARRNAISSIEERGLGGGGYQLNRAQQAFAEEQGRTQGAYLNAINKRRGELEGLREEEIARLTGRRQLPKSFNPSY